MSLAWVIQPPESGAARTLAARLDRAGLDDSTPADRAATEDWLVTLRTYEDLCNRGARMATFALDDDVVPVVQEAADERAYRHLAEAVAAFDAHAATGRAMIARLDGLLDRLAALPVDGWDTQRVLVERYLQCRYGPLPRPRPPGLWAWPDALLAWQLTGWRYAVVCRQAYRLLDTHARQAAASDFGPFVDATGGDNPLWLHHWPQVAQDDLDTRAATLGADVRAKHCFARRGRR